MSISLNANFELLSAGLYLDARQQFNTIIEMKDFAETSIPDGFITYNKETQKHYVFNSSNTVDATLGKWREYNSGNSSSTTYATWNSNVDYKVGNIVLKDEVRYSCIADHTSTDFETDSINWVVVLEQYYHVTQEQYNKMVSDGLITDSTKDLYIIDGNNEGDNNSTHKTVIFENNIDMGKYLLLAKITGANYSNNIIKFSCPNYKGVNDAGFKYENDMDIYKFELHFNTGARRETNSYGVTLKQHGLGLYSYPLSNPKNTEPKIEEAIRLYWDYSKGDIYVFLVDLMTAIPHCVLEYTGSGTLLRKDTFVMDDLYNRRDGLNGTWEDSKWKSIPFNKLEVPPIYELGGGSAEGLTTYTTIEDLGLTAPVTVGEIFNAMSDNTMAIISCEAIEENTQGDVIHVSDVPVAFGVLTIKKKDNGRFSIEYQNSFRGSVANVRRWIGTLKGLDGTGLIWKELQTEKTEKDDYGYIPDMYDRNANGDIPVVPFDRLANHFAIRTNMDIVSTTETEATYDEDYVGGYVFIGANDILVKDKEMFNKIKVVVQIPGVLRIGIVNDKIFEANPRYSTCLVKWLVADFVAFTGMKEYDIEDTVLEEGQSILLECRVGVSSWYLNTGKATQVGAVTYPANSCTTGLNIADKLDTTTNNALFKSQKVNSSSCLTSFGNNMYSIGGKIRGNFASRAYNYGAFTTKEADENIEYFGGLNIGLYRRTKYSDTRVCKCVENAMSPTSLILSNSVRIWFSEGQEALEGKSVYAIKLDVHTTGNLTICHCKGTTVDDFQIIDKYTHYVRAKGLQTIHLPFDIKLNKGEYIGLGGFHSKSTSDNIVVDTCKWLYASKDEVSACSWMNTFGKTGFYSMSIDPAQYPEVCTAVSSRNSGYLNVELICRGEKKSPLEDKYISFTGDSITTFAGFCTTKTGYPEGNPAGDNAIYYPTHGKVINNVDATWWGILARDNRMKILRNDAWSGSRVSSTEGSADTKCLCGTQRRYYLRNGYNFETKSTYPFGRPEIIVSMIGTNDLSGGVELGSEMFKGVMGKEEEYKTILSAFSLYCRRIHGEEGNGGAKIVHFLIPRGSDYGYANANGVTIADLSLHFERIAKAWGQYFIPLSYFNGIKPNVPKCWSCPTGNMFKNTGGIEFPSADGLHPNVMGMEVIADGVHRFLCSIM